MNENEMKKAFEKIEPEAGAQERMYTNILKKAAVQNKKSPIEAKAEPEPLPVRRRTNPFWLRWGSLAACLIAVLAASAVLPRMMSPGELSEPPVLGGSPFEDVSGPQDFERLDLSIDAPEGAENISYCIFDGEIARGDFTLDDHEYTYEAARLEGNFSRAEGEAVGSISLNAEYNAVLERLSPDSWRAHWSRDGVNYYLTNLDGADEDTISALANELI